MAHIQQISSPAGESIMKEFVFPRDSELTPIDELLIHTQVRSRIIQGKKVVGPTSMRCPQCYNAGNKEPEFEVVSSCVKCGLNWVWGYGKVDYLRTWKDES